MTADQVNAAISENDLLALVVGTPSRPGLMLLYGWEVHHVIDTDPPAKVIGEGFVDVFAARPPRTIVAELKSQRGRLTPKQKHWRAILKACPGVEYYLWRPSDRDEIEEVLR